MVDGRNQDKTLHNYNTYFFIPTLIIKIAIKSTALLLEKDFHLYTKLVYEAGGGKAQGRRRRPRTTKQLSNFAQFWTYVINVIPLESCRPPTILSCDRAWTE